MQKKIVMSLGGSIIVPDEVNVSFLKRFREFILEYVEKGYDLIIVCGGGSTARKYQKAARDLDCKNDDSLDWIGISSTSLNAMLIKAILEPYSEGVVNNPTEKIKMKKPVLIAAGWKPGHSTDHDAVLLAKNHGVKTVINLSDLDYVYDKDPKKHKGASPLMKMSWKEMLEITGVKWVPGKNIPFDPVAAKEAASSGLKVVFMKGNNLDNLRNYLDGKNFKGTVVE